MLADAEAQREPSRGATAHATLARSGRCARRCTARLARLKTRGKTLKSPERPTATRSTSSAGFVEIYFRRVARFKMP